VVESVSQVRTDNSVKVPAEMGWRPSPDPSYLWISKGMKEEPRSSHSSAKQNIKARGWEGCPGSCWTKQGDACGRGAGGMDVM
jgi:hypothetical protein